MYDYQSRVNNAKNIFELAEILRDIEAECIESRANDGFAPSLENLVDITSLPTFGGDTPKCTEGVYSWSSEHILVGTANDGSIWGIESRPFLG